MEFEAQGPALDRVVLTGPARRALGSETAEIAAWSHDLLYGGMGVAHGKSAVYRVGGTAWTPSCIRNLTRREAVGGQCMVPAFPAGSDRR